MKSTRQQTAAGSGAKPSAKPASQAPAKPAPRSHAKNAKPAVPPSGKKRKQTASVEEPEDGYPDVQEAPAPKKRKPTQAEVKAAQAAKNKGQFLIVLFSSPLFSYFSQRFRKRTLASLLPLAPRAPVRKGIPMTIRLHPRR